MTGRMSKGISKGWRVLGGTDAHGMKGRYILCAMLAAAVGFGCRNSRSRATSIAHEVSINALRADLILLTTGTAGGKQHGIPETEWPSSVQRFRPLAVQRHMGGVLIVTTRVDRKQEGLLVMLDPDADPGSGGSGVTYDNVGHGLFWCVEKIRDENILSQQRTNK
jgi:hypothetical protein